MTDNKEKDQNPEDMPDVMNGPEGDAIPVTRNKEEQERLQKRIEELRKRDPFIYR